MGPKAASVATSPPGATPFPVFPRRANVDDLSRAWDRVNERREHRIELAAPQSEVSFVQGSAKYDSAVRAETNP
jgi:hypothetical protein